MSAALQLPYLWAAQAARLGPANFDPASFGPIEAAVNHIQKRLPPAAQPAPPPPDPVLTYAFYRKHTENLLRRYLYASMTIGRSPTLLEDSVDRGWASSRKICTFEDALIFVIDVETCLKKLTKLDLKLISKVVVQENTQTEAAALLGISVRTLCTRLPQAIDQLTEFLVEFDLLTIPD